MKNSLLRPIVTNTFVLVVILTATTLNPSVWVTLSKRNVYETKNILIETSCSVVTCIKQLPWDDKIVVSSGGDGTVRLWNFVEGKQLQLIDLKEKIEPYKPSATDANSEDAIVSALSFNVSSKSLAVSFAKSPAVIILGWNDNNEFTYKQTLVVSSPILDIEFDLEGKLWMSLDGEQLVTIAVQKDGAFVEDKEAAVIQQINKAEVCKSDRIPDLYTIFGLRKFLDLPENLIEEAAKNKKRKTE